MRVSVVELTDDEVVFAPHDYGRWIRLALAQGEADSALEVGQVGDLECDGSEWLFGIDFGQRAELVSLRERRAAGVMAFVVSPGGEVLDLSGHGIEVRLRGKTQRLKFWRLVPHREDEPLGHFAHPDLIEWAAEIDREAEQQERNRDRARSAEQRANAADYFVNPYTFVPFPDVVPARTRPTGHHRLEEGRLSGRITARLVARSPLLVRNVGSEAPRDADQVYRVPRRGKELFVPGSSLHGAIRSLHETLTGSCLRVFDPEFVPVYRDLAGTTLRTGWGLGVVTEIDEGQDRGRPLKIVPCTTTGWVRLATLAEALSGGPVTAGQRFDLPGGFTTRNGRLVYDDSVPVEHDDASGRWIALVTDPSARKPGEYYCAVGKLPAGEPVTARLTDSAWQVFKNAAEGVKATFAGEPTPKFADECEDLARRRAAKGDADAFGATSLAEVLGAEGSMAIKVGKVDRRIPVRFLRPRAWLHPGRVVWIAKPRGGMTDGIALSYLWRSPGRGPAGERVPAQLASCHDPAALCPSCRLFGAADLAEDVSVDRRRATQRSYRGHVRILDAMADSATVLKPVRLPAVGSPRPGAGQFYLDTPDSTALKVTPRNRWGSRSDSRQLRGRKVYWHTDSDTDERRQRWRRHEHAGGSQGDWVELVARGSSYRLELRFDGLTTAELGGLVAALQPQLLFGLLQRPLWYSFDGVPEWAIHVGGGKSFGLGSSQVEDLTIEVDTAASRYLEADRPVITAQQAVEAFAEEHAVLRPYWPKVSAALHVGHVDSRIVGYPTAVPWDDNDGTCSSMKQHESFKWFRDTTGEKLEPDPQTGEPHERSFVPLPPVDRLAQGLPVHVRERA